MVRTHTRTHKQHTHTPRVVCKSACAACRERTKPFIMQTAADVRGSWQGGMAVQQSGVALDQSSPATSYRRSRSARPNTSSFTCRLSPLALVSSSGDTLLSMALPPLANARALLSASEAASTHRMPEQPLFGWVNEGACATRPNTAHQPRNEHITIQQRQHVDCIAGLAFALALALTRHDMSHRARSYRAPFT